MNVPLYTYGTGNPGAATSKFLPVFGPAGASGNWTGSESRAQTEMETSGTFSNLAVYVESNTTTGTTTIRMRINGANGNSVVTFTTGTGWQEDASNTDSLDNDEKVNYSYVGPTTITALSIIGPQGLFAPSGTVNPFSSLLMDWNGTTTDQYFPISSQSNGFGTTEGNFQTNVPFAATLQKCWTNNDINSRTGGTNDVIRSRINGGNGNIAVTLTLGAAAEYEDTSNTDSITAGDLVCLMFDANATSGRSNNRGIRIELSATDNVLFTGTRDGLGNNDADSYIPIRGLSGRQGSTQDTETNVQHRTDIAFTWSHLWGNSVLGVTNTIVIRTRINAGNGNQSITWTGASGEREDTSNTDAVAIGDLVNHFNDSTAGSGIVNNLSSMIAAGVAAGVVSKNLFVKQAVNRASTY